MPLTLTPTSDLYKPKVKNYAAETPKLGLNTGSNTGSDMVKGGIGALLTSAITGANPVAGMMLVIGTQLLGSWLSPEPDMQLTPQERFYRKRIAYFERIGKKRTNLKHLASGLTGKPASYFDKTIGPSNMSDVMRDDDKFAKHIVLADSEED